MMVCLNTWEVFLKEALLVLREWRDFESLALRKLVVAIFEIPRQEGQEIGKSFSGRRELGAAAIQLIKSR